MTPYWLDYERLQILLATVTVLALLLAFVFLALPRRPAQKVLAVAVFGAIALGAAWQLHATADARRTDCAQVEIFGSRVVVPACPEPRA
jgi:hypothetical protein